MTRAARSHAPASHTNTPHTNTPQDFSVDRFEAFADIFAYNKQYIPAGKTLAQGEHRTLTYGQLDDMTARLCRWFKDNGLKRGDRTVVISRDNIAVITLFMACLRYGLTAVILNPDSGHKEQINMIKTARPRALFADQTFKPLKPDAALFLPVRPGADHRPPSFFKKILGMTPPDDSYPGMMFSIKPDETCDQTPVPAGQTAYILFTSGTTSQPKGVEITHGNLLAQMKTFVRQHGYDPQTRILDILPLHHTDGLTQGPVAAFTAGGGVYRPLRFTVDKLPFLLDSVYAHRITHFVAVPSMLQLIDTMDKDADDSFRTGDFRFVISTAGYLDPHLWERFEKRFDTKIVNVYGLTETVCESLYCGPDDDTRKIGTIGKPVDADARIVDEQGQDVPAGETGELWLKGPHIMKGYFERPEDTAAALTEDSWFKTGDLVKTDPDGFYHIVGRKKNIIIVGGINIYPEDVANILRSMPGVVDAVVWGEDDPVWGETVAAAVQPDTGAKLDTDALSEVFLDQASVTMMPRKIHVVDNLPRGPAGKVILRDLKEQIATKTRQGPATEDRSVKDRVLSIAADIFKTPQADLSLTDTAESVKGWNSLAHVEFLLSLEKHFDIQVGPRDIMGVKSIGDARAIVQNKLDSSEQNANAGS